MKTLKLIEIHEDDAYFEDAEQLIGMRFTSENHLTEDDESNELFGYSYGDFYPTKGGSLASGAKFKKGSWFCFAGVKFE